MSIQEFKRVAKRFDLDAKAIACETQMSLPSVYNYLKKTNLGSQRAKRTAAWSEEKDAVFMMYTGLVTINDIASKLHMSRSTIRRWIWEGIIRACREMNITPPEQIRFWKIDRLIHGSPSILHDRSVASIAADATGIHRDHVDKYIKSRGYELQV
jgi:predicted DNA-binding transcriptional regulator AlpA